MCLNDSVAELLSDRAQEGIRLACARDADACFASRVPGEGDSDTVFGDTNTLVPFQSVGHDIAVLNIEGYASLSGLTG